MQPPSRPAALSTLLLFTTLGAAPPAAGFDLLKAAGEGVKHLAGEATKAVEAAVDVGRRATGAVGQGISGLGGIADSVGGDLGKALGGVLRDTGRSVEELGDTTASFVITGVARPSRELVGGLVAASAGLREIDLGRPETIEEAVRGTPAVGAAVVLDTERALERAALDASSIALGALPEPAERGARHAFGEAIRELEKKNPGLAEWLRRLPLTSHLYNHLAGLAGPDEVCSPERVFEALRTSPQKGIDSAARWASLVTTPAFKGAGVSGWTTTGCRGTALGIAVRDAVYSADDLVTIDLRLVALSVGGREAPPGRYLRIEVLPIGRARELVRYHRIREGEAVLVSGPVLMDNDLPEAFPEIHPIDDLEVVAVPRDTPLSEEAHFPGAAGHFLAPTQGGSALRLAVYEVQKGDTLESIARAFYGNGDWPTIYRANRSRVPYPDEIQPGWVLNVPVATRDGLAAGLGR